MKLIYGLEKVFVAQTFFLTGFIFRKINYQTRIKGLNIYKTIFLFLVFLSINLFLTKVNGFVDLVGNLFGRNYIIYLLNGIVGSLMILTFSLFLEKSGIKNIIFEVVSKSTIYILGFHEQIISIVFGMIFIIFKIPPETYKNVLLLNIIISIGDVLFIGGIYYITLKIKTKIYKKL